LGSGEKENEMTIDFKQTAETFTNFLDVADETDMANAAGLVSEFFKKLGELDQDAHSEVLTDIAFNNPKVFGQLLMHMFAGPGGSDVFDIEEKVWWMQVADHIGPNRIHRLKMIAAFMDKIGHWDG
jgi:hypothetical protein